MSAYTLLEGESAREARYAYRLVPRAADLHEWFLLTGLYAPGALISAFMRESVFLWTALDATGEPLVIAGVTAESLLDDRGVPWMICAEGVTRYRVPLIRHSHRFVREIRACFPVLLNYVHADNALAIGWLQRLGFAIDEPEPYGKFGAPFRRFVMGE